MSTPANGKHRDAILPPPILPNGSEIRDERLSSAVPEGDDASRQTHFPFAPSEFVVPVLDRVLAGRELDDDDRRVLRILREAIASLRSELLPPSVVRHG